MKLIPFDIEKAKAGAKVVTRDGWAVRMLCYDRKNDQPILSLVTHEDGREYAHGHKTNGEFGTTTSHLDLFLAVEPNLRPWKAEEVPVGALFRWKDQPEDKNLITTNQIYSHSNTFSHGVNWQANYSDALNNGEHPTDGGKTWRACGVEE